MRRRVCEEAPRTKGPSPSVRPDHNSNFSILFLSLTGLGQDVSIARVQGRAGAWHRPGCSGPPFFLQTNRTTAGLLLRKQELELQPPLEGNQAIFRTGSHGGGSLPHSVGSSHSRMELPRFPRKENPRSQGWGFGGSGGSTRELCQQGPWLPPKGLGE